LGDDGNRERRPSYDCAESQVGPENPGFVSVKIRDQCVRHGLRRV
jgi:hypothetical protein